MTPRMRRFSTEPLRRQILRVVPLEGYVWTNRRGAKVTNEGKRHFARCYADRFGISLAAAEKDLYRVLSAESCTEGVADRMATFLELHGALLWEDWST